MPTHLHVARGSAATAEADAVVVGLLPADDPDGKGGPRLAPGAEEVDAAFGGGLVDLLAVVGAAGKADEITKLPTRGAVAAPLLVAVGLGTPGDDGRPAADQVRRACGSAARALAGTGRAVTTLGRLDLTAAAEGTLLGTYTFTEYKGANGRAPLADVDVLTEEPGAGAVLERAAAVAQAVTTARDLVNTPPNDLFPASFAERARVLGEAAGLDVEVLDDAALAEAGYGGVLGVGKGSSRPPR
ncbi:MAG: M17 family peptidase N-terminal domain-containing protein, partial [Pseudonocardia sp.]